MHAAETFTKLGIIIYAQGNVPCKQKNHEQHTAINLHFETGFARDLFNYNGKLDSIFHFSFQFDRKFLSKLSLFFSLV